MFLIGETTEKVINGKLYLPKEYHLKKKDLLGKWKDENTLYLSDSQQSLRFATGDNSSIFNIYVDGEDRIEIPASHEGSIVQITGCITSVELSFKKVKKL